MRQTFAVLGICALFVTGAGCSFAMRSVEVDLTQADWERLAGDWRGYYTIGGRDRHGVIEFRLQALEHEAFGDVLMISDRFGWPVTGTPSRDGLPRRPPPYSQLLAIRFVAAERGMIHGSMDSYWDPDRECHAWASFLGSADGDVITGSFVSMCDDRSRILRGRWHVERRAGASNSRLHAAVLKACTGVMSDP